MCRHAAYIGPSAPVGPMMTDSTHSLRKQSYLARELLDDNIVNADGWGLAWYDMDVQAEPARLTDPMPIWNHPGLPSIGKVVRSTTFMGAVRSASIEGSNAHVNCAPFVDGRWSFSLNGYLDEFGARWRSHFLAEWIAPERRGRIHGSTDSEHIFQAFLTRLDAGTDASDAMRSLSSDVLHHAKEVGSHVQLNLLASDGDRLLATRAGNKPACNSLYHVQDPDDFPDGHLIASEPLMDDPAWEPVEPGTLLVVSNGAPPVRLPIAVPA